jgi:hypothetical protein
MQHHFKILKTRCGCYPLERGGKLLEGCQDVERAGSSPAWRPTLERSGGSLEGGRCTCLISCALSRATSASWKFSRVASDPRAKRRVARGWLVHYFDRPSAFKGCLEQASSWSPLTLSGRHGPLEGSGLESPFDWTFGFTFSLGRNNKQGYHLFWPDLPILLENQFIVRPTPSSVLCCLWLRPKMVADFVQLRRARYNNTACFLLAGFSSSNPQQME